MNNDISMREKQLIKLRHRLAEARQAATPEPISEYTLKTSEGDEVFLSELFGDQDEMLMIHNMGKSCPYCTLWADGFNGFVDHLESRAAFVLCSWDAPATIKRFAASRGWTFRTVSTEGSSFAQDMGFVIDGKPWPGVSAFHRNENGSIVRTGKAIFGPGDDFCAVWHLFDLLHGGHGDWTPKFDY